MTKSILKVNLLIIFAFLLASCANHNVRGEGQEGPGLIISPAFTKIAVGEERSYKAIYTNENGMASQVTENTKWTITNVGAKDATFASISGQGVVRGEAPGQIVLIAGYLGVTARLMITISPSNSVGPNGNGKDGNSDDKPHGHDGDSDDKPHGHDGNSDADSDGNSDNHGSVDTVKPQIESVALISATELRITYSEEMAEAALDIENYKISQDVSGDCASGNNFSDSLATTKFRIVSAAKTATNIITLTLSDGLAPGDYTLIVDTDAVKDLAGNKLSCPNTGVFSGYDSVPPIVAGVSSLNSQKVRVTFSEDVNAEALNVASYKIANGPINTTCVDNANFEAAKATSDFDIVSVTGSGRIYTLELSNTQTYMKAYTVLVDRAVITDLSTVPQELSCPNNGDFLGREPLKVMSAVAADSTHILLTFSKPVLAEENEPGSAVCSSSEECGKRYMLAGVSSLGLVTEAKLLDGTICGGVQADDSAVCITHSIAQEAGQYTVTVANGRDGDGFDDSVFGAILDFENRENMQRSPYDRASFVGQSGGTGPGPIVTPDSLIISIDPFNDGSDFGHLATYNGKIYVGPNRYGNSAVRFNPDGSQPERLTFTLEKDTIASANTPDSLGSRGLSRNTATSRDDGIAVPPYVTIGSKGCQENKADSASGCGPDNQDGRGLFTSGIFDNEEHLFITGSRSKGQNYYIYATTDKDNQLDYTYMDMYRPFHSISAGGYVAGNRGTESIKVFNERIYWAAPGNRTYRPYVAKIYTKNPESIKGNDAEFLMLTNVRGFGYYGKDCKTNAAVPNHADNIGATVFPFKNRLYLANSGAVSDKSSCNINSPYVSGQCEQLGGIIRSTNDDPAPASNSCGHWQDITPTNNEKYRSYFTDVLTSLSDLTPAKQPVPAMTEFNDALYLIRNACLTNRQNRGCTQDECKDDKSCPDGEEVPQLWKCLPDAKGECNADGWELVAEYDNSGKSNMGDDNNNKITLLIANGSRLYVGYDNLNGVSLWRTKEGVKNPSAISDFEQVESAGLGDTSNTELYSTVSLPQGAYFYLYISLGRSGKPLQIFRIQNL